MAQTYVTTVEAAPETLLRVMYQLQEAPLDEACKVFIRSDMQSFDVIYQTEAKKHVLHVLQHTEEDFKYETNHYEHTHA